MKTLWSKFFLILTVILMDFLVGMEFDIFVPSFPELQEHFQLTPFWLEASLSVNFIGFCLSLFLVGKMADRFGRKPVIIAGLLTFVLGSILCLYSPAYSYMLIGRFLQGAGVAAPSILSFLLIADAFELKKQQFYLAMLNGIMNISCAVAPVIGSYTTLYFHWQGNFILLLAIGLFVLLMSVAFVPKPQEEAKEAKAHPKINYKDILQNKPLMLLVAQLTCMFVPWWIFVGISPLLYMKDLGVPITDFGYYQGGLALTFAFGSILYGLIMDKVDQTKMLYSSYLLLIVSLVALLGITLWDSANPLVITLTFLLFIIGQIVPTVVLFPMALSWLPSAKGSTAAIMQGGRLILSSFALQLAGHAYTGSFQSIGIILSCFIFATIVLLARILKQPKLAPTSMVST